MLTRHTPSSWSTQLSIWWENAYFPEVFPCLFHVPVFTELWGAPRRTIKPGWICELSSRLQRGTLSRVAGRSGLPSCYFLTPKPLQAASIQWPNVHQHPPSLSSPHLYIPQGAVCVTSWKISGLMIVPQCFQKSKLCWKGAHHPTLLPIVLLVSLQSENPLPQWKYQ